MNHGSLFSGIGGFDLAAQWMGWSNVFHVERDPFCRQVLAHHFPKSQPHEDIKTFNATAYAGRVDIISGGFPCQPFSAAGKRAGTSDDRYLWPEMFRVVREARPTWVVAENVRGLLSLAGRTGELVFDTVCTDLEGEGYEVFPTVLPAAGVANCPHRRDRIWIVAYAHDQRGSGGLGQVQGTHGEVSQRHNDAQSCHAGAADAANASGIRLPEAQKDRELEGRRLSQHGGHYVKIQDAANTFGSRRAQDNEQHSAEEPELLSTRWERFPTVAPVCGRDDGLPERLDGITFPKWRRESIKAYGNAIVPQVAYQIFKALQGER
jgi:DNA (cytosine-5)-methyltransferase 1